jgi:hypothetical protein
MLNISLNLVKNWLEPGEKKGFAGPKRRPTEPNGGTLGGFPSGSAFFQPLDGERPAQSAMAFPWPPEGGEKEDKTLGMAFIPQA